MGAITKKKTPRPFTCQHVHIPYWCENHFTSVVSGSPPQNDTLQKKKKRINNTNIESKKTKQYTAELCFLRGWCTVHAKLVLFHTLGDVRLSCTNSVETRADRFNCRSLVPGTSWHRSPAAQGMVQTAVRERLPRHLFVIGVSSLLRRRYISELRANGRKQAKLLLSVQFPCQAQKNARDSVIS